jgi:hypothetical protein
MESVTGEETPVPYHENGSAWLKALQTAVGGYIEVVGLPWHPALCLVVNEEGLLKDLETNMHASMLAGQRIVGPVVLLPRALL